jgi:hypothetical protein
MPELYRALFSKEKIQQAKRKSIEHFLEGESNKGQKIITPTTKNVCS